MGKGLFIKADEIATELGVSKQFAYKLIQRLNKELEPRKVHHHQRAGEQGLL